MKGPILDVQTCWAVWWTSEKLLTGSNTFLFVFVPLQIFFKELFFLRSKTPVEINIIMKTSVINILPGWGSSHERENSFPALFRIYLCLFCNEAKVCQRLNCTRTDAVVEKASCLLIPGILFSLFFIIQQCFLTTA